MQNFVRLRHWCIAGLLAIAVTIGSWNLGTNPAWAGLENDRYDGNIFVLYAGNGSLVPTRITLAEALQQHRPVVLVFYVDDSRDCKEYALVVSRLQESYDRVASFIPVDVDSLALNQEYSLNAPGHYYRGFVPQVVVFDQNGDVRLDEIGQVAYEKVDDVLREVFNLLPRSESVELKRRPFNEFNAELSK
ncbi:MAG: thylakoid membrane photosystem I accumulation factor [Jaaginema sp. PMC 1079.18]|nr:thylakoid membrane photosystem I accumulation factor [Jaaginema sp. PMC 1080.18]MEC4851446.1 thylakoid membrane photosystem I accumulation factor [Jaaginema sp. PMC 1079.18]MEC4868251.1 thylakoid membrane photosystem I accumulation factor [Jaaginema sp. PMC 1078.18]